MVAGRAHAPDGAGRGRLHVAVQSVGEAPGGEVPREPGDDTMRRFAPGWLVRATVLVGLAAAAPADARTAEEIVAEVRAATARYLDIGRARDDGYVQTTAMEPRHGYHFSHLGLLTLGAAGQLVAGGPDLRRPATLLYVERAGVWQLVGVEYAAFGEPAGSPFPGARWHRHDASCHYRDYRERPSPSAGQCPARHPESGSEFVNWHPAFSVVHVWAWYPNPAGVFAEENPYLAPYGGTASAGHQHRGLSGTEIAYSEFNHRTAGVFLVVLAAVILWESRRLRPFPWNALSAPIWIVCGLYLFTRSDPEAWPYGPKSFGEIFTDHLVLQHKLLTLIPVMIGLVEGLRAAGYLRHAGWRYLFPVLGVFGGIYLFFHFHDGGFHLDRIYLQHAAMGVASLGVAVTVLFARRQGLVRLRRLWPVLVLFLGLILLVYSET